MPLPKAKLSKFFKSFAPLYVLGTTYTVSFAFFESVVFPLIDRKKLKRCVLLCDQHGFQRARAEAFALRVTVHELVQGFRLPQRLRLLKRAEAMGRVGRRI